MFPPLLPLELVLINIEEPSSTNLCEYHCVWWLFAPPPSSPRATLPGGGGMDLLRESQGGRLGLPCAGSWTTDEGPWVSSYWDRRSCESRGGVIERGHSPCRGHTEREMTESGTLKENWRPLEDTEKRVTKIKGPWYKGKNKTKQKTCSMHPPLPLAPSDRTQEVLVSSGTPSSWGMGCPAA